MKKFYICLLACILAAGMTGCVVTVNSPSMNRYEEAEKYASGNFSYAAQGITRVEADWVAGNITVVQSEDGTLKVEETGELTEKQRLHWLLEDGVLKIQYCASGYTGTFPAKGKALTLEVPVGIDLSIDSVSGQISLGDGSFGALNLDTTSGKIDFDTVRAEVCKLDTVSGDIMGDTLLCEKRLKADTTSGRVDMDWLEASEAEVETVSGSIDIKLCRGQEAEIQSTSGSITLILGETLGGAAISFESASGSFHGDGYKVESGRYVFGDGTCRIEAETVSGSLTVK